MILITSAAYVGSEFQAELGKIPPCMLPLGNWRLIEHQLQALRDQFGSEAITVSLPEGYELPPKDRQLLSAASVSLTYVPPQLTLCDSLVYALNTIGVYEGQLHLLHGDTLIRGFPPGPDVIGVQSTREDYNWEVEQSDGEQQLVWCGYFSFSDIRALIRSLIRSKGDFVKAVRHYSTDVLELQRIMVDEWFDLGHVNTYFSSRARITTQRAFNSLTVAEGAVVKTGEPAVKILAEANWYRRLPPPIKVYAPQLLDAGVLESGAPYYSIEYLRLSPLNELFVHGRNPPFFWQKVFGICGHYLELCRRHRGDVDSAAIRRDSDALIAQKTRERLARFAEQSGVDLKQRFRINGFEVPPVSVIMQHCIEQANASALEPGILHGDFCLSNILFDSRANTIKVVDPRGLTLDGQMVLHGDLRYDVAKLAHSVIGLYDFIVAGAFTLNHIAPGDLTLRILTDARIGEIQELFAAQRLCGDFSVRDAMPQVVLLFLSMLPLHSDDPERQMALFANALKLYAEHIVPLGAPTPVTEPVLP